MPVVLFQQTTDKYGDTEIDASEQLRSVSFAVSAPYSALYQVAKAVQNGKPVWDLSEIPAQPGQGGFADKIFGIRFKSFDPAHPTTILCKAFYEDDPVPTGDLSSTAVFNTGGQVSPGGSSVQVEKNGILIGTEPILDFLDATGFLWTLTDDLPNTRILITPPSSPVRMIANGGSVVIQNSIAETTLAGLQIPAGGMGTNGFGRLTVQGLFQNNTGANQDWPTLRFYITVVGVGSTLLLDTGSIGFGGGMISSGNFAAWRAVFELHNVGGTGFIDANVTLHGGSGGSASLSGTFVTGFGQWLTQGEMVLAEGNVQGIAADTTKPIQMIINAINFVANPNYLISARYSQLEACAF
jgi:hypothetical protein